MAWWSGAGRRPADAGDPRLPPAGGWRSAPVLQRVVEPISPVAGAAALSSSLATWRDPSFLRPLSHTLSAEAPAGTVGGLVDPVGPAYPGASDALPVPSAPAGATAAVQRRGRCRDHRPGAPCPSGGRGRPGPAAVRERRAGLLPVLDLPVVVLPGPADAVQMQRTGVANEHLSATRPAAAAHDDPGQVADDPAVARDAGPEPTVPLLADAGSPAAGAQDKPGWVADEPVAARDAAPELEVSLLADAGGPSSEARDHPGPVADDPVAARVAGPEPEVSLLGAQTGPSLRRVARPLPRPPQVTRRSRLPVASICSPKRPSVRHRVPARCRRSRRRGRRPRPWDWAHPQQDRRRRRPARSPPA